MDVDGSGENSTGNLKNAKRRRNNFSGSLGDLSNLRQFPYRTARQKQHQSDNEKVIVSIPIANDFELLADDNAENPNITPKVTAKKNHKQDATPKRPKPIVAHKTSIEVVRRTLADLNVKCNVSKIRNTTSFQIFPNDSEEKKKIQERLVERTIQFHTYSEPSDRHEIFILKGHYRVEAEELLKELNKEQIPAKAVSFVFDPKKIRASGGKRAQPPAHPKHQDDPDPIYRVFFPKGAITFNELQKHRTINYLKVCWEKNKNTNKKTQCHRCQLWGHSAVNCNREFRCVKCLESHEAGKCKRTTTEGEPSCVNCGKSGHISSAYECEAYKRYAARTARRGQHQHLQQQAASSQQRRTNVSSQAPAMQQNSNPVNTNVSAKSYSEITSGQNAKTFTNSLQSGPYDNSGPSGTKIFSVFEEFNNIEGIQETLRLFSELVQKLKGARNIYERIGLLVEYTGNAKCP